MNSAPSGKFITRFRTARRVNRLRLSRSCSASEARGAARVSSAGIDRACFWRFMHSNAARFDACVVERGLQVVEADHGDVFHGGIERCKLWAVEVEVAMIESAENLALHGSVDSFKRSRMIFRNLAANFECVVVPVSVGVVALSEEAAVFFIAARCAMQSMRRCEFVGRGDFDVRLRHGVAWIRES